jgi:hypothetical protein
VTDDSSIYATAVMLDPRLKCQYFDRNWKKSWIEKAEVNFKRLVRDYTQQHDRTASDRVEIIAPTIHRTALSNWKYKENAKANRDFDELKEYFKFTARR